MLYSTARYILAAVVVFTSSARGDFPVNVRTSLDQAYPAIAAEPNGNFVVVWHSYYQDKSNEIRARLFSKDGAALTGEIETNQTQAGNQKEPAVVTDGAGGFIVVWQGPGDDGNDIWCRRFDANGAAGADEFIVNSNRVDEQVSPNIAMNSSGLHMIVWESEGVPLVGAKAICGQLFDADGNEVEGELVLSDGNDRYRFPAVALSDACQAVVVWVRDSGTQEIWRRGFAADGNAPVLGSVKVNDDPPNFSSLTRPVIAMDSAGNYVIAWDGHPKDHDEDDIYLRAYNWSGANQQQYQVNGVNDVNDGAQWYPALTLDDDGKLVVLWEAETGDDKSKRDICGRRFFVQFEYIAEPVRIGDEFRMNTYVYQDQRNVAMAGRSDGTFVGVWQSNGQDGSYDGIFGRIGPLTATADLNGDGFVDFIDFSDVGSQWMQQGGTLTQNLVNDNKIDLKDIAAFCEQWLTYRYSCEQTNISGDGGVDLTDFAIMAAGWRHYGPLDGDIDGNGTVDQYDLQWLTLHWAQSCE